MSLVKASTHKATEAWRSPDGQRVIYDIVLEVDGEPFKTQTFSEKIATVGFEGEIEVYTNDKGKQFVRQAQKEGQSYGGGYGGGRSGGASPGRNGYSPQPKDQFTMYLSYAKDLMVACIARGDKIDFEDAVTAVIGAGHTLYDSRPDATTASVKELAGSEVAISDIPEDSDLKADLEALFDKPKDKFDL